MKKGVGSGVRSGSISQRYGSEDPDPHQNVTDSQHWQVPYHSHDDVDIGKGAGLPPGGGRFPDQPAGLGGSHPLLRRGGAHRTASHRGVQRHVPRYISRLRKRKKNNNFFAFLKSPKKTVGHGVGSGAESGSISQRYGSGSAPKCHGSPTLTLSRKVVVSLSILASQIRIHYSITLKIFYPVHWDWISVNNRNKEGIGENTGEFTGGNFCRLIPA
jgi:hypothetical protein